MSTYSAQVRVEDGMLHTSRPLTAPEPVADLIDSLVYSLRDGQSGISAVEVTIDTEQDSGTPVGDSVTATSSTPIADSIDTAAPDDGAGAEATVAQPTTPPVPGQAS